MLDKFKLEQMKMDPFKEMRFKEYLDHVLRTKQKFGYQKFQKMCGISRKQWEMFKSDNLELEIDWVIE